VYNGNQQGPNYVVVTQFSITMKKRHFFFAERRGEDRVTFVLSTAAFDQVDRSPLYCLTSNFLLIEMIVLLLHDIRAAMSFTAISVDERR
jgi:hypothetical protein